jgi:hypothetical protein
MIQCRKKGTTRYVPLCPSALNAPTQPRTIPNLFAGVTNISRLPTMCIQMKARPVMRRPLASRLARTPISPQSTQITVSYSGRPGRRSPTCCCDHDEVLMLVPVRGGATRCQPVEPVTEAIALALLAERRRVTNTKELLTLHDMRAATSFLGPSQRSTTAWDVTLSLLTVSRLGRHFCLLRT